MYVYQAGLLSGWIFVKFVEIGELFYTAQETIN